MRPNDPNIGMIQLVSQALGQLRTHLVFVGGCATGLLVTEEARPPARATIDVDLVAEVSSFSEYYRLSDELRLAGFNEHVGDVNCRWHYNGLIVDVMPTTDILGNINRWYVTAIEEATEIALPNGNVIKLVSAPLLLATKIEAFYSRGNGDYVFSRDIEDIITVVDGRPELAREIAESPDAVREYLREEMDSLLADPRFAESVSGHLHPDEASQARLGLVLQRLRSIAGL